MRIQVIMPMAGEAKRFNKNPGDLVIKPLIGIKGRRLFQIALSSLTEVSGDLELHFIAQEKHLRASDLEAQIRSHYPKAKILSIDRRTNGPAETLELGMETIGQDLPVLILDCDLYFESKALEEFLETGAKNADTALLTFSSQKEQYSYVRTDQGMVVDIREKEVISEEAVCGCYYFKSGALLKKLIEEAKGGIRGREVFISDLIKVSLQLGFACRSLPCDTHLSFGTPDEISQNSVSYHPEKH